MSVNNSITALNSVIGHGFQNPNWLIVGIIAFIFIILTISFIKKKNILTETRTWKIIEGCMLIGTGLGVMGYLAFGSSVVPIDVTTLVIILLVSSVLLFSKGVEIILEIIVPSKKENNDKKEQVIK